MSQEVLLIRPVHSPPPPWFNNLETDLELPNQPQFNLGFLGPGPPRFSFGSEAEAGAAALVCQTPTDSHPPIELLPPLGLPLPRG